MLGILKRILAESPDRAVDITGNDLSFKDYTYSFFKVGNKLYVGEQFTPEMQVWDTRGKYAGTRSHGGLALDLIDKGILKPGDEERAREFPCAGRAWPDAGVLSFWTYPKNHSEMMWLIKELNKNGIKANERWSVEMLDDASTPTGNRVVPITSYKSAYEAVDTSKKDPQQQKLQFSKKSKLAGTKEVPPPKNTRQMELFSTKGKPLMQKAWPSVAGHTRRRFDPDNPLGFVPHRDPDKEVTDRRKLHAEILPIAKAAMKKKQYTPYRKPIPKDWTYAQYHGMTRQEEIKNFSKKVLAEVSFEGEGSVDVEGTAKGGKLKKVRPDWNVGYTVSANIDKRDLQKAGKVIKGGIQKVGSIFKK